MNQRKKILFITGTRADYGKIKPIMQKMEKSRRNMRYLSTFPACIFCRNTEVLTGKC